MAVALPIRPGVTELDLERHIPAHFDIHELRAALVCAKCHTALDTQPVTTRCGETFCKRCALDAGGCPVDQCRGYSPDDCPHDVSLGYLVGDILEVLVRAVTSNVWKGSNHVVHGVENNEKVEPLDQLSSHSQPHNLPESEISSSEGEHDLRGIHETHPSIPELAEHPEKRDARDLASLIRAAVDRSRFTCVICHHCFLEPMTLRCGHTFCRECLHSSIDSSSIDQSFRPCLPSCPTCRTKMTPLLPPGPNHHHEPTWNWINNCNFWKIIRACWVPELRERQQLFLEDETAVPAGMDVPLFVCLPAIPTQPTALRVFEPKYRNLLRRVLRTRDRTFGMTNHVRPGVRPPYATIGTLLRIETVVYEPRAIAGTQDIDMEIYVFSRGISRFQILETRPHGSYMTARIAPVHDISRLEDETLAAHQIGLMRAIDPSLSFVNFDPFNITLDWLSGAIRRYSLVCTRLTTDELMRMALEFIEAAKESGPDEQWETIILENHGPVPQDVSELSWWAAGVFMGSTQHRQTLLQITSPRQRLLLVVEGLARRWPTFRGS